MVEMLAPLMADWTTTRALALDTMPRLRAQRDILGERRIKMLLADTEAVHASICPH